MPQSDQQIIEAILKEIENLTTIMTGKNQFNLEEDLDFDIIYQIVEKRVPEFKKHLKALAEKKPPYKEASDDV